PFDERGMTEHSAFFSRGRRPTEEREQLGQRPAGSKSARLAGAGQQAGVGRGRLTEEFLGVRSRLAGGAEKFAHQSRGVGHGPCPPRRTDKKSGIIDGNRPQALSPAGFRLSPGKVGSLLI